MDNLYNKFNHFLPGITIMCNASQVDKNIMYDLLKLKKNTDCKSSTDLLPLVLALALALYTKTISLAFRKH